MVVSADRGRELLEELASAGGDSPDPEIGAWTRNILIGPEIGELLSPVLAVSPFLRRCARAELGFLKSVFEIGPDTALIEVTDEIKDELIHELDTARLMARLRILRRRVALLVALADVFGLWSLERVTHVLSEFADCALSASVSHLLRLAAAKEDLVLWDDYFPEDNCGFFILGMGKYGARELNYSSDIDLIALFDPEKVQTAGRRPPQRVFMKIVRQLVSILQDVTKDGYVFRVDLRLRPDPSATPVVTTGDFALNYYKTRGAEWERAAMIKARPAAGDLALGRRFLEALTEFVWRPDIDFWTQQQIGAIKRQINEQKGGSTVEFYGHNVKLGRGGIREIEFFAQTHQLLFAGRDTYLRHRQTIEVLHTLSEAGHIGERVADELTEAYEFLRRLEHRLQMIEDQQTQLLPSGEQPMRAVAAFMGYPDLAVFEATVLNQLAIVSTHYQKFFGESRKPAAPGEQPFSSFDDKGKIDIANLKQLGFIEPALLEDVLDSWQGGRLALAKDDRCREIFLSLIPLIVEFCATSLHPDEAMHCIDRFFRKFSGRTRELSLLKSNPDILHLLIRLATRSPALVDEISSHPEILQAALAWQIFESIPDRRILFAELDKLVPDPVGLDENLARVGRWSDELRFQIKANIVLANIEARDAGHQVSALSDALLVTLTHRISRTLVSGKPIDQCRFALLALGRYGRRELLPDSKLDLLFLHDEDAETAAALARCFRDLIRVMNTPNPGTALCPINTGITAYETSRPVLSSLPSFIDYCRDHASLGPSVGLSGARLVLANGGFEADLQSAISTHLGAIDRTGPRVEDAVRSLALTFGGGDRARLPVPLRVDRLLSGLDALLGFARLSAPADLGDRVSDDGERQIRSLCAAKIADSEAQAAQLLKLRDVAFRLQYFQAVAHSARDFTHDWTEEAKASISSLLDIDSVDGLPGMLDDFEAQFEDAASRFRSPQASS